MPIVTKPNTFVANEIIDSNQMNQNFDSIYGVVNGGLDSSNIANNGINDFGKLANEVVLPSKSKGLVYGSDLYTQNWVVAGGLATFSGSPANQIQVNTVSANILQVDGSYRHVSVAATSYTTSALNSTYFLDLQPDGTMSWGITHSAQAGYLPLATVTTNGSGNVLVVTDVRVLSAGIAWINLSKVSSSLADLATRSASDLSSGTLNVARLPTAIPAPNIGNGDVTNTQLSYLNSLTSNVQTQLNSKSTNSNGAGNPNGVVTPTVVGQLYTDTNTGIIYTATTLSNTSWIIPTEYYGMAMQAIINGGMAVAQTLTSINNPANNTYTLDMWVNLFSNTGTLPTAISHAQQSAPGEIASVFYKYGLLVNGAGSLFGSNDFYGQAQRIEFGTRYLAGAGKKVSVSFYASSTIASKHIAVGMKQTYGTGGSPSAAEILTPTAPTVRTLSSTMSLYTFTFTTNTLTGKTFGTNNDDYLELTIYEMWGSTYNTNNFGGGGLLETFVGSGSIYFTAVQVNAGDVALPFQPKSYNDEYKSCLRYFEQMNLGNGERFTFGLEGSSTTAFCVLQFSDKRVIPAVTGTGTAGDYGILGLGSGVFPATSITFTGQSLSRATIDIVTASGLTAGYSAILATTGLNKYIKIDARL